MKKVEFNKAKEVRMKGEKVSPLALFLLQILEYSGKYENVSYIRENLRNLCRWKRRNKGVKERMRKRKQI